MSKHNFVRDGVMKLPPGFRFQPTDEELLFHYLRCKIFSLPLPDYIIPELPFSKLDPPQLPGDSVEESYFFTKKRANFKSGNKNNRANRNCGYWEVSGSEEHISPPPNLNLEMMMMGVKKTLVFNTRNTPNNWFMHEYSLALFNNGTTTNTNYKNYKVTSDWVICQVFNKKMEEDDANMVDYNNSGRGYYNLGATTSKFNDMMVFENTCPCSSSSSSNSIANESQSDEETSYFL